MGQTWSKPSRHTIRVQESGSLVTKDVVVFGGGYDVDQDIENGAPAEDGEGRAIYIVDAVTGALLWSAGETTVTPTPDLVLADMDYGIPSEVRVIDINGDSYADRMYVGDMGGQVWRFDIDNFTNASLASRITGGRIADLKKNTSASTPGADDSRRFYYAPDIALVRQPGQEDFLSVAIGSGYRAHPLNQTVQERFYMIRDHAVSGPPTSGDPPTIDYGTPVNEGDLFDATSVINFSSAQRDTLNNQKEGWYISLNNEETGTYEGEKVLAPALTFAGMILFTTSTPVATESTESCSPSQGVGRLYAVNLLDATPVQNLDGLGSDESLTRADRTLNLVRSGLPPEVTVVFPPMEGAQPVALVGAERLGLELNNSPITTYWYQE